MTDKNLLDSLQEFLVPRLNVLEGKIEGLHVEIRRLDEKIDSLDKRLDTLQYDMRVRFDSLERRIETTIVLHERLAAIEAKLGLIH